MNMGGVCCESFCTFVCNRDDIHLEFLSEFRKTQKRSWGERAQMEKGPMGILILSGEGFYIKGTGRDFSPVWIYMKG